MRTLYSYNKHKIGDTFRFTDTCTDDPPAVLKGCSFILLPYPTADFPDIFVLYFPGNKQRIFSEGDVTMFDEDFEACNPVTSRLVLCEKTILPNKYWKGAESYEQA